MTSLFATAGLVIVTTAPIADASVGREQLIERFDELIAPQVASAVTAPGDNLQGGLAWGRSYLLAALVEMLDATRDPKYADLFVKLGNGIAEARDDRHGRLDVFRDRVVPAWGSLKYTQNKHYAWAVHTGMIAAPMARFAAVVRGDESLSKRYGKQADQFFRIAQEAVAVHDDQCREGPGPDEGYLFGYSLDKHLPLNMQNALARAWIFLDDAACTTQHREWTSRLARFLKNRLRTTDDGAYVWSYWPELDGTSRGFEDISHAAINADFMALCFERRIVFTQEDMARLEKTLLANVLRADGTSADRVGGTGDTGRYAASVLRWGRLARHSEAVRDRLLSFYRAHKFGDGTVTELLGIAYLVSAMNGAPPATSAPVKELAYKDRLLTELIEQVPSLLASYDAKTGRFGEGIWISTDQERMYPLAVAYSHEAPGSPYYKDAKLLEIIMKAGDALIDDADARGQWVFRKKDGSTWGKIWMPWMYSRWVRTYSLIRDDMPADRRARWRDALTLGYEGIRKEQLQHVHNIPTHHAMGLYAAGKALDRPEWCEQASAFLMKVVEAQAEGGYWSEHVGPVVGYNRVYIDSLGTYYAMSGDARVLPALGKAARFHYQFRYPDGSRVETIDERNPYHGGIDVGNVGFTFTPIGRAFLAEQWGRRGWDKLGADLIASLELYGQEGAVAEAPADALGQSQAGVSVLSEKGVARAATVRRGPWFACLSAYTAEVPKSRWIQDRQNFVSLYHDKVGLILGGGNTKLQPAWSNFTVGDMGLLRHKPGDTKPDFRPKGELYHVPSAATLVHDEELGLDLRYGPARCRIRIEPRDDRRLDYVIEATGETPLPILAHLTLMPHLGKTLRTAGGTEALIDKSPVELSAAQVAGGVTYAGYRLTVPETATVHWPALPHNPYRKDGRATAGEGRIEVRVPFDEQHRKHTITLEILK